MFLGVLAPAVACWGPEYESVHFNNARPDFLRLPEPWWRWPGHVRAIERDRSKPPDDEDYSGPPGATPPGLPQNTSASDAAAKRALRQEAAGRFQEAAALWEEYAAAKRREWSDGWSSPETPDYSPGLPDRIRALRKWRGTGDTLGLRSYLRARGLLASGKVKEAETLLRTLQSGPFKVHVAYLQAGIRFQNGGTVEQVSAYRRVLALDPKHLPSLYMIGRCYFSAASEIGGGDPPPSEPKRTEFLRKALAAYEACAGAAPTDPLGKDAVGMAAACRYRLGEYPLALLTYCRQLARLKPGENDPGALTSARWCLRKMSEKQHPGFQMMVATEPGPASVYLDLLLRYGKIGAKSNYRLGLVTLDLLRRYPEAPVSGRFLTRLSLIEDRAGRHARAEKLAAQALTRCPAGADRDEARWQRALALHHEGRPAEALQEYERVAQGAVLPRMRLGAHEAAAVLSERNGDYANAIRHYFALEYRLDYAYAIDCLASADDLRGFLRRFPTHPRAKLVRYSLGFRQLRAGEYEAAADTFASLGAWLNEAEKAYAAETSKGARRTPPLETARFLAKARRREAAARAPEERARIAYEAARFTFHQRHLAFYNGALWKGSRTSAFEWNAPHDVEKQSSTLSAGEQSALRRYAEEHAALHQALRAFERIAERYPRTPEAPKALYSAALCYTLLPSLERYWADRKDINYTGKAIQLYRRLQRDYPHDSLAAAAAKYGGPLPVKQGAAK
jgi:tetratricopeptide (TPR) repeat protein